MTPEIIEEFAIRAALGNNGGAWATHYTEAQKEHWRQFVRDLAAEMQGQQDKPEWIRMPGITFSAGP